MSPAPSTIGNSATQAGVMYGKQILQEVCGTAVNIMQLKYDVPEEFRGCNISRSQRVSADHHVS
jgi:hypothetical protein